MTIPHQSVLGNHGDQKLTDKGHDVLVAHCSETLQLSDEQLVRFFADEHAFDRHVCPIQCPQEGGAEAPTANFFLLFYLHVLVTLARL